MAAAWTVSQLERNTADGGVTVAHWRVSDSETVGEGDEAVTYSASSYGTCGFVPDPSSSDFIAYADLTESTVLDWCWASGVDKDEVETSLTASITEQKNPTQASGVPW
jgi:hypothetical protein